MAGQRVQKCFFSFRDFVCRAGDADGAKRLAIACIYRHHNQLCVIGGVRRRLVSDVNPLASGRLQCVPDDIVLVQP